MYKTLFFLYIFSISTFIVSSAGQHRLSSGKDHVKKGPQHFAVDRRSSKKGRSSDFVSEERTEKDWQALVGWYDSSSTPIKTSNLLLAYDVLVYLYQELKAKSVVQDKECDSLSAQVKEKEEEIQKLKKELCIASTELQKALDSLKVIYHAVKPKNSSVNPDFNDISYLQSLIMKDISARQTGYIIILNREMEKYKAIEKMHQELVESNKWVESLKNIYKAALVTVKRDFKFHQQFLNQFLNGYEL